MLLVVIETRERDSLVKLKDLLNNACCFVVLLLIIIINLIVVVSTHTSITQTNLYNLLIKPLSHYPTLRKGLRRQY